MSAGSLFCQRKEDAGRQKEQKKEGTMNKLIPEANELLKNGGFEYAFCGGHALDLFLGCESRMHGDIDVCAFRKDRNRIIQYMRSQGFEVYEMLGGGRVHHITDESGRFEERNIFCVREGCPMVKLYPPDGDGCCWMEFFHVGQTRLDYIELLFNDKTKEAFEYARNREITREPEQAILISDGIPYLAPELCLLYKSTDMGRDGYQQDFELAWKKMDAYRRAWLRNALLREYPAGHPWTDTVKTAQLVLHFVSESDLPEVSRTWPSDHRPVSEKEAMDAVAYIRGNYEKNTVGCVHHLILAVCGKDDPGRIMGWCGLDGRRSRTEPEIFILLDEEYRHKGYGTQCVKGLLKTAVEDYSLQSVHGGCAGDNTASRRAMEKGGMVQYGTEDNGDPLFRFTAGEKN